MLLVARAGIARMFSPGITGPLRSTFDRRPIPAVEVRFNPRSKRPQRRVKAIWSSSLKFWPGSASTA